MGMCNRAMVIRPHKRPWRIVGDHQWALVIGSGEGLWRKGGGRTFGPGLAKGFVEFQESYDWALVTKPCEGLWD